MNNALLIHNDNTPLINKINNTIKFNPSIEEINNSDIDLFISIHIIPQLLNRTFNIIYIKDTLSNNYLDFYGLKLAYHIRLSQNTLDKKSYFPIVILSDINEFMINRLSQLGRILFTKKIFLCKNDIDTISYINTLKIIPLNDKEYKYGFINLINVKPPQDYLSHHSIANEWAMHRWAEYLDIITKDIGKINTKLSSMLYFKYLKIKYPLPKMNGLKFRAKYPKLDGTILYIDDQWKSGWKDIFENYFLQTKNINFSTIEKNYKDESIENILEFTKKGINDKNPDLILLDLRFHEEDYLDNIIEKNIIGIKLLKYIKEEVNPGIQIILLTASGKSTVLNEANKYNIVGYIKKEHPEDITISTKENFSKLKNLIDDGLEKKYLKEIWTIQKNILNLDIFKNDDYHDIEIEIKSIFNILNSNIKNPYNLIIFTFTKCLEALSLLYINEYSMKYLDDDSHHVGIYDYNENSIFDYENEKWYKSTSNRLHNILFEKLDLVDIPVHKNLCELINCRNYIAHPNERQPHGCDLIKEPNDINILNWFKLLKTILSKTK